eukprot:c10772_g1_i1 orf=190-369(+)
MATANTIVDEELCAPLLEPYDHNDGQASKPFARDCRNAVRKMKLSSLTATVTSFCEGVR